MFRDEADALLTTMGPRDAISVIAQRASDGQAAARARWLASTAGAGPLEQWVRRFATAGRLTLNFHPDRVGRHGHTVAAGLAADGTYQSQWISGISAGSRSALHGGERHRFERELFAGVYDEADPSPGAHPVYGSFDLVFDDHGGSPRFGSSYVVLRAHMRERTTLCVGDSHMAPRDVGTFERPGSVLAALTEQAARSRLLNRGLDTQVLLEALEARYRSPRASRDLDGYIEAQVHGGVSLADDVEAIVLDPSFRGSDVERDIATAARQFGFDVAWHCGSVLCVDDVPGDFRGPTMPALARKVADADGTVHARAIGIAAARERFEEPTRLGDSPESVWQQLKYLWHTLLAHGRDAAST